LDGAARGVEQVGEAGLLRSGERRVGLDEPLPDPVPGLGAGLERSGLAQQLLQRVAFVFDDAAWRAAVAHDSPPGRRARSSDEWMPRSASSFLKSRRA